MFDEGGIWRETSVNENEILTSQIYQNPSIVLCFVRAIHLGKMAFNKTTVVRLAKLADFWLQENIRLHAYKFIESHMDDNIASQCFIKLWNDKTAQLVGEILDPEIVLDFFPRKLWLKIKLRCELLAIWRR